MKPIISLISLILFATLGGGMVQAALGIPMPITSGSILAAGIVQSIAMPNQSNMLFMGVPSTNVDAVAKWAGMYSKQMLNQMLNGLDILADNKVDRMVSRNGKLLPKFTALKGMRPLDVNIEENNAAERNIGGRMLYVYDMMKLFKIVPDEEALLESFMSDMIAPGAKEIPYAQWIWQKEMEKLASEVNDNFWLQRNNRSAPTFSPSATYTAGQYVRFGDTADYYRCVTNTSAGESPTTHPAKWAQENHLVSFDGPAKIIADAITASQISPVITGAISTSNAGDRIQTMYDTMTVAHRNAGGHVKFSWDVYQKYLEWEKAEFPYVNNQSMGDGIKYVYGSAKKWVIKPCTWMGTSQRIVFDVKNENLVVGTNLVNTPGVTNTVPKLHGYLSVAKWLLGFQIADLEALYVNDQA